MSQFGTGDLLIEFLTEELPPINLEKNIGESFSNLLFNELKNYTSIKPEFFVTPRRFACIFKQISSSTLDQKMLKKGPSIIAGLKDGEPTNALKGFLKSCGIDDFKNLEQRDDGYFYAMQTIPGQSLAAILPTAIEVALKKLPIAKNMRWGNNDYSFVRPVHNLIIMFDNQIICENNTILGLSPVNYTYGHRMMSNGKITLNDVLSYKETLHTDGKVIANFNERQNNIQSQLNEYANKLNLKINHIDNLLDEVTGLVEYPVVLSGEFNPEFLQVPQECLILSMAKNQKYFALLDNNNKLSNKFLFVANIDSKSPEAIINGNQKVLAARLNDAKFFYEVDKKHSLEYFNDKLKSVVYHNKLGSQYERIQRLQKIATGIATIIGVNPDEAHRAAKLLKFDLNTEMVGEFPELQGIMGKYYALFHGESINVANAIEKHYYPRFSGDELPDTLLATVMALSDKLETLVGIWGIGLTPSGDKDPFALRRAALGIARILLTQDMNLDSLLDITFNSFNGLNLNSDTPTQLFDFILDRLNNYLVNIENYPPNLVNSVVLIRPYKFNHLHSLLKSLEKFSINDNNKLLISANKRIKNILEKNGYNVKAHETGNQPDTALFNTVEEENLYELYMNNKLILSNHAWKQDWDNFFATLAKFNHPITIFFDNVMVMDKDDNVRRNRINLLLQLYSTFNQVCELTEI
jgi:glycyl-tRNA synthetase beta chain